MDKTIQFVHKTWGDVWVVIAISSYAIEEAVRRGLAEWKALFKRE